MVNVNHMDLFFDVRIWKEDIQYFLDIKISDDEFDKIMESFDVFHLDDLIKEYISSNKESISYLLMDERKDVDYQLEIDIK